MLYLRRVVLALCLAAAPILLTACSLPKPQPKQAPVLPPRPQAVDITPERLASNDYSIFLKIVSGTPARAPYEDEMDELGVLWPRTAVGMNAGFFFTIAGAQMKSGAAAPAGSAFSDARYEGDRDALNAWLADNRFALGSFDMGLTQTVCRLPVFIAEPRRGQRIPLPPMLPMRLIRFVARLNSDRAFMLELLNEPARAAETWMAGMKAGGLLQSQALLIEQLVGGAMLLNAGDGLARLMANADLPEEQIRRVLEAARASEITPADMVGVWEREGILQRFIYTRGVGNSRSAWRQLWRPAPWQTKRVLRPDVPDRDVFMAVLPTAQAAIKRIINRPLAQLVADRNAVQAHIDDLAPGAGPAWIYYLQFGPIIAEWANMAAQQNVEMRALQVRAAIALYQTKHKKLPAELADLKPEFLPDVPTDPFSGKALKYAVTKDGWKLWSVGLDREDNGGQNASPDMPWNGPDAVFLSRRLSTEQVRRGYAHVLNGKGDSILEPARAVPAKAPAPEGPVKDEGAK